MSERRDDRGTRAADLRKISAAGALPVEHDQLAPRERAVGIWSVGATGKRTATRAAAATRTVHACRGYAPRGDEFVGLDDVAAGALEVANRQMAAGPVRARQHAAVRGDADGRPAAARSWEVAKPEYRGEHRLGSDDRPPVALAAKGVVLALGREVQRQLHAVKADEPRVVEPFEAEAVGRDARLDAAHRQVVEDSLILRVQPVLADAEIHRGGGNGVAHAAHIRPGEPLHHHVGPVAVRATQITLVGQPDTDRERCRHANPPTAPNYYTWSTDDVTAMLNYAGVGRSATGHGAAGIHDEVPDECDECRWMAEGRCAAVARRPGAAALRIPLVAAIGLEGPVRRLRSQIGRRPVVLGAAGDPASHRYGLPRLPRQRDDPALDLLRLDDAHHGDVHCGHADSRAVHAAGLAGRHRHGSQYHDRHSRRATRVGLGVRDADHAARHLPADRRRPKLRGGRLYRPATGSGGRSRQPHRPAGSLARVTERESPRLRTSP